LRNGGVQCKFKVLSSFNVWSRGTIKRFKVPPLHKHKRCAQCAPDQEFMTKMTERNIGIIGLLSLLSSCTVDHVTYVYDDTGQPIEGVTINYNGENYKSDSLGFVKLRETRFWFGEHSHFEGIKKENHNYHLKSIGRKNDTTRITLVKR
jgi:hypothetical protein